VIVEPRPKAVIHVVERHPVGSERAGYSPRQASGRDDVGIRGTSADRRYVGCFRRSAHRLPSVTSTSAATGAGSVHDHGAGLLFAATAVAPPTAAGLPLPEALMRRAERADFPVAGGVLGRGRPTDLCWAGAGRPATIEGAVRSGQSTPREVLAAVRKALRSRNPGSAAVAAAIGEDHPLGGRA